MIHRWKNLGGGKCLRIDGVQYVRLTFLTFFFNAATVKLSDEKRQK